MALLILRADPVAAAEKPFADSLDWFVALEIDKFAGLLVALFVFNANQSSRMGAIETRLDAMDKKITSIKVDLGDEITKQVTFLRINMNDRFEAAEIDTATRFEAAEQKSTARLEAAEKSTAARFDAVKQSMQDQFSAMEKNMAVRFDAAEKSTAARFDAGEQSVQY